MNPVEGQVHFMIRSKITVANIILFYSHLVSLYPNCTIYIIQDNWPVHFHPNVLAALVPQKYQHWMNIPDSWKNIKVKKKYQGMNLPIQLVPLPTYSPWLNPIEKLWLWLNKDVVHNHQYTDQVKELTEAVTGFLNQFDKKSPELLKFVGLKAQSGQYADALKSNP